MRSCFHNTVCTEGLHLIGCLSLHATIQVGVLPTHAFELALNTGEAVKSSGLLAAIAMGIQDVVRGCVGVALQGHCLGCSCGTVGVRMCALKA
jgi:hypothetical protein